MTQYADCVVGTETGVMNAAGGLDVPKVIMLSHSTEENLTKYWKNTTTLCAYDAPCYPCHRMHYELKTCTLDPHLETPICMAKIKAKAVYDAINSYYQEWKTHPNERKNVAYANG